MLKEKSGLQIGKNGWVHVFACAKGFLALVV